MKKFYVTFAVCILWSLFSFAQVLEKIDDSTYILRTKDQPQPGGKYFSFSSDGKKSALFVITGVDDNGEISAKLLKGKPALGQKVLFAGTHKNPTHHNSMNNPAQMSNNQDIQRNKILKKTKIKKPFLSAHGILNFGSGTLNLTTKSGATGSTTANISGFGVGIDADHWIGNLSLGAEFRYSSMSVSASSYTSSTTLQEFAGSVGYLMSGTQLHLKTLLYVYSSGISGLGGFSGVAKYLYNNNFALQAEYRTLNTTSSDASGNLSTAFNMFGFGGVFNY